MKKATESKANVSGTIKELLDGSILTKETVVKQLPYILFLAFLSLIYIGNRFHAEEVVLETHKLEIELKDLKAESISIASELMVIGNQSTFINLIHEKNINLNEATKVPLIITVKKEPNDTK